MRTRSDSDLSEEEVIVKYARAQKDRTVKRHRNGRLRAHENNRGSRTRFKREKQHVTSSGKKIDSFGAVAARIARTREKNWRHIGLHDLLDTLGETFIRSDRPRIRI